MASDGRKKDSYGLLRSADRYGAREVVQQRLRQLYIVRETGESRTNYQGLGAKWGQKAEPLAVPPHLISHPNVQWLI